MQRQHVHAATPHTGAPFPSTTRSSTRRHAIRRGAVVALAGLTLAACAFGGSSGVTTGTSYEQVDGRGLLEVELDDGTVSGVDTVVLGFDAGELSCDDPSATLDPFDLPAGTAVTWVRQGDGVDESNPPVIGARNVVVSC